VIAVELLHHLFDWEIVPGVTRDDDDDNNDSEPADIDAAPADAVGQRIRSKAA
jgi:hypothetical protein